MTKKDFQLLRCLFVQDIVFITFTIPLSVSMAYQAATLYKIRSSLEQAIVNFIINFCTFLHYSPYCASFYIFVVVSKAFRNEPKRMIYKICGKDLAPIREEENKQENIHVENIE
jgi:hypothetical protein